MAPLAPASTLRAESKSAAGGIPMGSRSGPRMIAAGRLLAAALSSVMIVTLTLSISGVLAVAPGQHASPPGGGPGGGGGGHASPPGGGGGGHASPPGGGGGGHASPPGGGGGGHASPPGGGGGGHASPPGG